MSFRRLLANPKEVGIETTARGGSSECATATLTERGGVYVVPVQIALPEHKSNKTLWAMADFQKASRIGIAGD